MPSFLPVFNYQDSNEGEVHPVDASLTLSAQDETASNGGKPNEVQTAEPVPVNVPHTHSAPTRHPLKSALKSSSQPREKVASTAASNNNESNQAGGEEGEEDDLSDLYPEVTPEVLLEVRRRRAAFTAMLLLLEHGAGSVQELAVAAAPLSETELLQVGEERALAGRCGNPLCGAPTDPDAAVKSQMVAGPEDVQRVTGHHFCSTNCAIFLRSYAAQLGNPMLRLRAEAKAQLLSHAPKDDPRSRRSKVAAHVNGVTTLLAEVKERDPVEAAAEAAEGVRKQAEALASNQSAGAVEGYEPGAAKKGKGVLSNGVAYVVGGTGSQRVVPPGAQLGAPASSAAATSSGAKVTRNLSHLVHDVSAHDAPATTSVAGTSQGEASASVPSRSTQESAASRGDGGASTAPAPRTLAGAPAALRSSLKRTSSTGAGDGMDKGGAGAGTGTGSAAGAGDADGGASSVPTKKGVSFAREDQVQEFYDRAARPPQEPVLVFTVEGEEGGIEGELSIAPSKDGGAAGGGGIKGSLAVADAAKLGPAALEVVLERERDDTGVEAEEVGEEEEEEEQEGGRSQVPKAMRMWFPAAAGGFGVAVPKGKSKKNTSPAVKGRAGAAAGDVISKGHSTETSQAAAGVKAAVPSTSAATAATPQTTTTVVAAAGQAVSPPVPAPKDAAAPTPSQPSAATPQPDPSKPQPARKFTPKAGARRGVVRLDAPPDKCVNPNPVEVRMGRTVGPHPGPGSARTITTTTTTTTSKPAPAPASGLGSRPHASAYLPAIPVTRPPQEVLPFEDPAESAAFSTTSSTQPFVSAPVVKIGSLNPVPAKQQPGKDEGGAYMGADGAQVESEGESCGEEASDDDTWYAEGKSRLGRPGSAPHGRAGARREEVEEEEEEDEWSDQDGEFGGADVPGGSHGRGRKGKGRGEEEEGEPSDEDSDDAGAGSGYSSDQDPNYASAFPFFSGVPQGYRVTLSPYNETWSVLSSWVTSQTIDYMTASASRTSTSAAASSGEGAQGGGDGYGRSAGQDSAAASAVLSALPPPSAQQVQRRTALAELLAVHLSQLCTELAIKVPTSEISKRFTGLLSTLVLPGPVPSLSASQWRLMALAMLRGLALHRLTTMQAAFECEGAGQRLEAVLQGLGFSLPHLSALVDLLVSAY